MTFVLWGGRGYDIQIGSLEDRLMQNHLRLNAQIAIMGRNFQRVIDQTSQALIPAMENMARSFAEINSAIKKSRLW